jgi:hypothetical protein
MADDGSYVSRAVVHGFSLIVAYSYLSTLVCLLFVRTRVHQWRVCEAGESGWQTMFPDQRCYWARLRFLVCRLLVLEPKISNVPEYVLEYVRTRVRVHVYVRTYDTMVLE